jgi:hypothetical protein
VWECDGTQLTLEVLAEANHKAVCQVRERLQNGNLVPLVPPQEKVIIAGCGHSSGAALCIVQQAHYQSFDLIGNFGAACGEIKGGDQESGADPLFIINNGFVTLDQDACLPLFCLEDVPKDVQQAYKSYSAPSPIGLLFVAHPEKLAQFAENIDIPTLIVFGEHDLVLTPCEEIQFYKSAKDCTLYEHLGAAHHHNIATTRYDLWTYIYNWLSIRAGKQHCGAGSSVH